MIYSMYRKKWNDCQQCALCKTRTNIVHYRGSPNPKILFIGEAPGQSEDIIGPPFVGAAGQKLHEMLDQAWDKLNEKVGFYASPRTRESYFGFMNVLGCLPADTEGNARTPTQEEIIACRPRFLDLLNSFLPKKVCALGKIAEKALETAGAETFESLQHPAFLLRQKNVLYQDKWVLKMTRILAETLEL